MHDDDDHHLSFFLPRGIKQRLQNSFSASCRAAARFISFPPLQKLRKTPKTLKFLTVSSSSSSVWNSSLAMEIG
jgi:hypothetical protein